MYFLHESNSLSVIPLLHNDDDDDDNNNNNNGGYYYYYFGSKFCPSLLEGVDLRVPNRNFREFKLFHFDFNLANCPAARCALATNAISRDSCIFNCKSVSINDLLPVSGYRDFTQYCFYITFPAILFCLSMFSIAFCVFVLSCVVFVLSL
jgi:hypothetical protein